MLHGSPVLSTTATAASVPGVYPINAAKGTLSAADYSFNLVAGSLTVTQAQTNTAVSDLTNPSAVGQSVTFSATVSPIAPGAGVPAGTVTFKDGGATLGTGTLVGGKAMFTTSTLALGVHLITAVYGGNADFSTSTSTADSHRVEWATKITLSDSANPSVFGQKVTLKATVAAATKGAGTPTGSVTFKDAAATLGTVTLSKGSASLPLSTLTAGSHSITAVYNGDTGLTFAVSTSAVDSCTVKQAKTRTALSDSAKKDTSVSGTSVTFTATVLALAPGAGVPTGWVTFVLGGVALSGGTPNPAPLSAGTASFTISTLSVGKCKIAAVYSGNGNFAVSTSPAVTHKVSNAQVAPERPLGIWGFRDLGIWRPDNRAAISKMHGRHCSPTWRIGSNWPGPEFRARCG